MKTNPLLHWEYFPQFSRIRPEHVLPAMNETIEQSLQELIALEQTLPKTWHGLLVPLERLIDRVSRTWGLVTHLYNVTNSPALREVHSQAQSHAHGSHDNSFSAFGIKNFTGIQNGSSF